MEALCSKWKTWRIPTRQTPLKSDTSTLSEIKLWIYRTPPAQISAVSDSFCITHGPTQHDRLELQSIIWLAYGPTTYPLGSHRCAIAVGAGACSKLLRQRCWRQNRRSDPRWRLAAWVPAVWPRTPYKIDPRRIAHLGPSLDQFAAAHLTPQPFHSDL